MSEQLFTIDTNDKLLDIDADEYGNYIAITERNEIITRTYRFTLLADCRFSCVRRLLGDLLLVVSARTRKENNVFIYNGKGQLQLSFFAGDGIQDVVIVKDKIVFTYFDEGVSGAEGPNNEGLAVFNYQGELLYGFNSATDGLITDCYSICKLDEKRVLFYPYTKFQVIELDLDTFNWKEYETPELFLGAHSMVYYEGSLILHGTYYYRENFFLWDMKQAIKAFGNFTGWLRGLTNGKFIAARPDGFSIVSPLESQ